MRGFECPKPPVDCSRAPRMLSFPQMEYERNEQDPEHGHIERHITKTERKETLSMSFEKSCSKIAAGEKFWLSKISRGFGDLALQNHSGF